MDYSVFKPLFGLLMFGTVFAFGFQQLYSLKAERRRHNEIESRSKPGHRS